MWALTMSMFPSFGMDSQISLEEELHNSNTCLLVKNNQIV